MVEEASGEEQDATKKKVKKKKGKGKKKKKKGKKAPTIESSFLSPPPARGWNTSTNVSSSFSTTGTFALVDRIRQLRGEKTPTKLVGRLSDATMKKMQRELLIASILKLSCKQSDSLIFKISTCSQ